MSKIIQIISYLTGISFSLVDFFMFLQQIWSIEISPALLTWEPPGFCMFNCKMLSQFQKVFKHLVTALTDFASPVLDLVIPFHFPAPLRLMTKRTFLNFYVIYSRAVGVVEFIYVSFKSRIGGKTDRYLTLLKI